MFKLQRTRIQNMQFAEYINSDTPVTLKQSYGHQTYNDNVDPKQGYNSAQFEKSFFFNDVQEKAIVKVFFKQGNMSIISLEHMRK